VTEPALPGPAADRDVAVPPPVRRRPDPMLLVVAGVAVGIAVAALHRPQPGMYIAAVALAAGAVLRLVLRPRTAGSLVVRSRRVDVAVLALLAVAVGVLAAVTPFPAGR
jgi:hypothetical protein